jgi:hypothetical protein
MTHRITGSVTQKATTSRRRTLQQVCIALSAEGRPTRTGKLWTKQLVNRILGQGSGAGT